MILPILTQMLLTLLFKSFARRSTPPSVLSPLFE